MCWDLVSSSVKWRGIRPSQLRFLLILMLSYFLHFLPYHSCLKLYLHHRKLPVILHQIVNCWVNGLCAHLFLVIARLWRDLTQWLEAEPDHEAKSRLPVLTNQSDNSVLLLAPGLMSHPFLLETFSHLQLHSNGHSSLVSFAFSSLSAQPLSVGKALGVVLDSLPFCLHM